MIRLVLRIVGSVAIVAAFFIGTLFVLDRYNPSVVKTEAANTPQSRDRIRAENAKALMSALESYRASHKGAYPAIPDHPVDELKNT